MPYKIRLKTPVPTHNGEIKEITFRDPMGAEVFTMSLPYRTIMTKDRDAAPAPPGTKQVDDMRIEMVSDPAGVRKWLCALAQDGVGEDVLVAVPAKKIRGAYDWLVEELTPDEDAEKN